MMNKIIILLALAVVSAFASDDYLSYVKKYEKEYKTQQELDIHAKVYADNVRAINRHNANPHKSFSMGINQFTDMTNEERVAYKGGYGESKKVGVAIKDLSAITAPDSWDWRDQGAVNPIKDQGQCGTCWAFASTSSVESAYFISSGNLLSLSESQQIDCNTAGGCNECAFEYLISNQACSESDYSYQCPDNYGGCQTCNGAVPALSNYTRITASDEDALLQAVYVQPVAIGIAASGDFMGYSGGVFDGSCPGGRDHAVVLVGYGSDNGTDYWILRNQWGTGWGEQGYMRIARGANAPDGLCLLATDPSVPNF